MTDVDENLVKAAYNAMKSAATERSISLASPKPSIDGLVRGEDGGLRLLSRMVSESMNVDIEVEVPVPRGIDGLEDFASDTDGVLSEVADCWPGMLAVVAERGYD